LVSLSSLSSSTTSLLARLPNYEVSIKLSIDCSPTLAS
jgi:hypothetical protein